MADKIVRYKIEITKISTWVDMVKENVITKKTPTGAKKTQYGSDETIYAEEYAVADVTKRRESEQVILTQEVESLDLAAVIKAINGI